MEPHHILAKEGDIAERVILAGDSGRVRKIAGYLDNPRRVNTHRGLLSYTGTYNGIEISIVTHGMGAPSTAIVLEELGHLGAKKFVRFGTAGALAPNINSGDYVIASSASHPPGGIYTQYFGDGPGHDADADPELTQHLQKSFSEAGLRFHGGRVFSSDALYAESPDFAKKQHALGDVAVEMECAILYKLSRLRGWKSSAVLMAVNNLNNDHGAWMSKRQISRKTGEGVRAILDGLSKA